MKEKEKEKSVQPEWVMVPWLCVGENPADIKMMPVTDHARLPSSEKGLLLFSPAWSLK